VRPHSGLISLFVSASLLIHGLASAADESSEALQTIVVSADASKKGLSAAYAGDQVARGSRVGILGTEDMMDTPFSITSYTQSFIANQQAQSVGDVLRSDPAVRVARGFGNYQQLYIIRGLPVYSDDMAYNGLYGLLPRQYLAAELVERIEVLRGASAFLNGAAPGGSGLGGAINVMPKRAPNQPLADLTVGTQSGSQVYLATDLATRFGPDNNSGIRFNAVRRNGGTAVDGEHRRLTAFALGLDSHLEALRVSFDLGYQDHDLGRAQPSVTVGAGVRIPSAPDATRNLSQPWAYSKERDLFGTFRLEYDLTDAVTFWAAAGARDGHEAATFANPSVFIAPITSTYRFDNRRHDEIGTAELGIRAQLNTGPVSHKFVASLDAYNARSKNAYGFSNFAGFSGDLYNPTDAAEPPADFFTGGKLDSPLITSRTKTSSAALADLIGFLNDRVILALGGRYQRIEAFGYDYNSGAPLTSYSESKATPVGALVVKLNRHFSVYANYIEGLVQGDTAPSTYTDPVTNKSVAITNIGAIFAPYVTRQEELGLKFDLGHLGGTLSVFNSSKPVGSADPATGIYAVSSHQRDRGAELSMFGEPIEGLRVMGGASWLKAEFQDKIAIGSPPSQYDLGLEWDVPGSRGLTVEGKIQETASQYADAANTQSVRAWWRADLGARYVLAVGGNTVTVRGRVENVANRNDWVSVGGYPGSGYLVLGDPRTWRLEASFDL
jgi:iron complex outermembrane receptor protein